MMNEELIVPEKPATNLATSVAKLPTPVILQPGNLERHAASLKHEELLAHVKTAFGGVRDTLQQNWPYLLEARNRFAKPGQRVPVEGKPTWTQWVKANLQVDVRTVQRWLAGPKANAQKEKQRRPVKPLQDWPAAMRRANDLVTAVRRLHAKTPVGTDMLIPALRELAALAGCQLVVPKSAPEPQSASEPKLESEPKLQPTVVATVTKVAPEVEESYPRMENYCKSIDRIFEEGGWGINEEGRSVYEALQYTA